jgi:feruloyl esterase
MKPFAYLAAFSLAAATPLAAQPVAPADGLKALPAVAPATPCEALVHSDFTALADAPTHVLSAKTETDGATGKAFCHVTGFVTPQVRFEMKLPAGGWTQRLLMTGCGGLCGMISLRVEHANDCLPARQGELAIVATDMGHEGQGGAWADKAPELRTDFAYRGVHVVTLAAKAIVAKYYGQKQAYAYFSGCSDGGREALMEAERYPADYDGITAGAPAANFTIQNSFYHAWDAVSNTGADGHAILLPARLPLLHAAVLKACDTLDGVADGLIADPTRCHFDPATIQCAPGQVTAHSTQACLTPAEVETVRRLYAGPHDDKGNRFVVGTLMPGSELAWRGVEVPMAPDGAVPAAMFAEDSVKYLLNVPALPAAWHVKDFAFDMANFAQITAFNTLYGATDPDLSAYFNRGGRLLLWHGWSDPHISPINSIAYYRAVEATLGAGATRQGMRFYLFPGLYHCGGGDGLNQFDVLTPMMAWVEGGRAPDTLKAAHAEQHDMMQGPPPGAARPGKAPAKDGPPEGMFAPPPETPVAQMTNVVTVAPYPMLADFTPAADGASASQPVNGYVKFVPDHWAGDSLYKPYVHTVCGSKEGAYACTTKGEGA